MHTINAEYLSGTRPDREVIAEYYIARPLGCGNPSRERFVWAHGSSGLHQLLNRSDWREIVFTKVEGADADEFLTTLIASRLV